MSEAGKVPASNGRENDIILVYDFECPACDLYCRLVHLPPEAGTLRRVNAREPGAVMDEITAAGLDIDQGMVVRRGGRLSYASDAIRELALAAEGRGFFNRINRGLFGSRSRAQRLYPVLRSCRNFLLKLLRKRKINNLHKAGNERF